MVSKKSYLAVMVSALAISNVNAEITMSFENFAIKPGEKKDLDVYIETTSKADDKIDAIEFTLVLPEGLSVQYVPYEVDGEDFSYYNYVVDETFDRPDRKTPPKISYEDSWQYNNDTQKFLYKNESGKNYLNLQSERALLMTISLVAEESYRGGIINFTKIIGGYTDAKMETHQVSAKSVAYTACIIGTGGYSTFSAEGTVQLTGADAFYGVVTDDKLVLSPVKDNIVKAGTGVVLKGVEGTAVSCAVADFDGTFENDLVASDGVHDINGDYVLATSTEGTQFYQFGGSYVLPVGKAYIPGSKASGARLMVSDNESGISSVVTGQKDLIYNLQGQKLSEAKKGINVVNGKKVLY